MRTAAWLYAVACFAAVIDMTYTRAEKVREAHRMRLADPVANAVEDWEYGVYLAAGVGLAAAAWLAGAAVPPGRRVARLVAPTVRGSVHGAVAGGLLTAGFGAWQWAAGERESVSRFDFEGVWLVGTALGAFCGAAVGGGLGAVAYLRPTARVDAPGPRDDRSGNPPPSG